MKIIVGLGNPGLRYKNTRHNTGFLVLKVLSKRHNIPIKKKAFRGLYGIGRMAGHEVMLFEPMTYMNLSGEAVKEVISSKIEDNTDLLVVSDDVNLPAGRIRLREGGSSGGHNGLESITGKIGSNFARLRAGVGPDEKIKDLSEYVLAPFSRGEKAVLAAMLEDAADAAEAWLRHGIKRAMNNYNSRV